MSAKAKYKKNIQPNTNGTYGPVSFNLIRIVGGGAMESSSGNDEVVLEAVVMA